MKKHINHSQRKFYILCQTYFPTGFMPKSKYGHYTFTREKPCQRCGALFLIDGGNARFCAKCRIERENFHRRQNIDRNKNWRLEPGHKITEIARKRKYYLILKMQVLEVLGGKCIRCGNADHRCLQIDHVNGGGTKDIRQFKSVQDYFREVIRSSKNHEGKYQLLCANCNCIKRCEKHEVPKPRSS